MVFNVCGLVKRNGKVIANGIDGRFETKDERVISILQNMGFSEVAPVVVPEVESIPRKLGRPPKHQSKESK